MYCTVAIWRKGWDPVHAIQMAFVSILRSFYHPGNIEIKLIWRNLKHNFNLSNCMIGMSKSQWYSFLPL